MASSSTKHVKRRRKNYYEKPLWVKCSGSWKTRLKKAKFYLRQKAFIPVKPDQQDGVIFLIMANLRLYFCLSLELSISLIREIYFPRLEAATGQPVTWTDQALRKKGAQVTKKDVFPTLGIDDPKAVSLRATRALEQAVERFLIANTEVGGKCDTHNLRELFITQTGMGSISPAVFGKAVVALTGIASKSPFGRRHYPGFHIVDTAEGLIQARRNTSQAKAS